MIARPDRIETEADDPYIRAVVNETIQEAEESPTGLPPLATRTLQLDTGQLFEVPEGVAGSEALDILKGRYKARLGAAFKDKAPRRILDVGAGVGAFAVWASTVWPSSWIDCLELDPELAQVCAKNLPLGAKMINRTSGEKIKSLDYELVRIGDARFIQDSLERALTLGRFEVLYDCLFGLHVIPKRIIQTWFGKLPPPRAEMQTWREHHPSWEVVVVDRMTGWKNQEAFDFMRELNGKSDIARYELLADLGGIYVDADSVCLRPLDDRFLTPKAWATWEHETERPGMITGAFMGSIAGGAFVRDLVELLPHILASKPRHSPAWYSVGPHYVTNVAHRHPDLSIFPSRYFCPEHYTGTKAPKPTHRPFTGVMGVEGAMGPVTGVISIGEDEPPFARHLWGNTAITGGYVKILGSAAIITSMGKSATLERAIRSVLAQTQPVKEIIVMCGDRMSFNAAAESWKSSPDEIRFEIVTAYDRDNLRDEGVRWPRSPFMFILDGDEELAPTWLEEVSRLAHGDDFVVGLASCPTALFTKEAWPEWSRTSQILLSAVRKETAP